jgi:hypothetical protein
MQVNFTPAFCATMTITQKDGSNKRLYETTGEQDAFIRKVDFNNAVSKKGTISNSGNARWRQRTVNDTEKNAISKLISSVTGTKSGENSANATIQKNQTSGGIVYTEYSDKNEPVYSAHFDFKETKEHEAECLQMLDNIKVILKNNRPEQQSSGITRENYQRAMNLSVQLNNKFEYLNEKYNLQKYGADPEANDYDEEPCFI